MKQVLQSYRTGELRVADVPAPRATRGTVLVQTRCSLVSAGTDRMALELARKSLAGKAMDRPDLVRKVVDKLAKDGPIATARAVLNQLEQPLPFGYSACGVVVERGVGAEVRTLGERVACAGAKVASHAEFNAVPLNLCVPVPDAVSDEAAAFATLGAIALQGVRTAQLTLGERVGVIGLGLVGQLALQLVRAQGCRVIGIDVDAHKVELAKRLGADVALLREGSVAEEVARLTEGRGLDAILLCAATDSNDPIDLAGELSRDRGRVVVVGAVPMNVPRRPYYDKELVLLQSRSYGPGRYDASYEERGVDYPMGYVRWTEGRNLSAFLEQCALGRVDVLPLITHRFPVASAEAAYELISGKAPEPVLGIVLNYPNGQAPSRSVVLKPMPTKGAGTPVISLLGTGNFAGSVLGPLLAKRSDVQRLTATSARGVSALAFGERFKFAECSSDDAATLADPRAHGIIIATRHDAHARQAAAALRAKKGVLVEKPLALDEDGLREVVQAAAGQWLMVDFNRRYAPLVRSLKVFFADAAQPFVFDYRICAGVVPSDAWLHDSDVGGGRLVGEVCHFIDLLAHVAQAEVESVLARAVRGASGAFRNDDQLVLSLELSDGSVGSIVYTAGSAGALPKERLEAHSGGHSAVLDDFKTLSLYRGQRVSSKRSLLKDKGHQGALDAFVGALKSGESPQTLRSLVSTSMATFAARESLNSGQSVEVRSRVDALLSEAGG